MFLELASAWAKKTGNVYVTVAPIPERKSNQDDLILEERCKKLFGGQEPFEVVVILDTVDEEMRFGATKVEDIIGLYRTHKLKSVQAFPKLAANALKVRRIGSFL